MLLIKLLRFIQGYIDFKADEGFPERFINLCAKNSLPLWNMKNIGGCLYASTVSYAFNDVKKTAEKVGMELTVIKESSLKGSLKKHKSRNGILFSLLACLIMTAFLSCFIWSISVEGNESYSKEQILIAFEENGVKIGALKHKIDTRLSSEKSMAKLDNLSWAKVNIRGCFAVIEVRESIKKPTVIDDKSPVNIIAKADGEIIKYEVERGEDLLKPNIAVTKGDLLVSGVLTNKDGSERLVHSLARITAKTTHNIRGCFDKALFIQSEESIKYSLFFFGLKIPSYKIESPIFESRRYLDNKQKILPAGIFRYRQADYTDEYEITNDDIQLLNAFDFDAKAINIYRNSENVINAKYQLSDSIIKGNFICEEEIGIEKEILTE